MATTHWGYGLQQHNGGSFDADSSNHSLNNSGSAKPKRSRSDPLDALAALPEVRPIPWIAGRELPPEASTESARSQTKGAFLMATRGVARNPPCSHCASGSGRFTLCVSLPGWFGGSCATCQMSTRANRCTLRLEGTGQNAPGGSPTGPGMQQSPLNENRDLQSSLKRKRDSEGHITAASSRMQEVSPEAEMGSRNAYAPLAQSTNHVAPRDGAPIQGAAQDDSSSLLQYVYQKLNTPNGTKRHHIIDQASGGAQEVFGQSGRNSNSTNTAGTASYNREQLVQDTSNSLSPTTQLLQPAQPTPYIGPYVKNDAPRRSETRDEANQGAVLFDSLPRKKQKQILGIIGGLQSGIRTAKQQTDSLQKQLDLLQSALGIGFDDEDDG